MAGMVDLYIECEKSCKIFEVRESLAQIDIILFGVQTILATG